MHIAIGVAGTVLWLFLGWYYVPKFAGLETVMADRPGEAGTLLIGFFAPLALFWVIVGSFQQGALLRRNVRALETQGAELKRALALAQEQAEDIRANALHGRRDTFLRVAQLTTRDLDSIAVEIARATGPSELFERTLESRRAGHGDAFFNLLVCSFANQELDRVVGALERSNDFPDNIQAFVRKFDTLLREADAIDPEGSLPDHFRHSAMAKVSDIFRDVEDDRLLQGAAGESGGEAGDESGGEVGGEKAG